MLDIIATKIEELKTLDKKFKVFGSEAHKYKFYESFSDHQINNFQQKHEVNLPEDYLNFMKRFGNGGCGPGYGLIKIENGVYDIPLNRKQSEIITLKNPFRLNTYWNLENYPKEDYDAWEEEYDDIKWTDGMLRISHLGCGVYSNLIVTGKEKGNIWIDDRGSEGGIYPQNHYTEQVKYDFLSWYLNWLNYSIEQLTKK